MASDEAALLLAFSFEAVRPVHLIADVGRDPLVEDGLFGRQVEDAHPVRRRLELGMLARNAAIVEPEAGRALTADRHRGIEADLVARLERFRSDDAQDESAD